ncbi:hypothetical protein [Pseudomonas fragariae (ex Marin et al. 2024)]|uniref:hypothetical protein n=1 Tax=Pseudomonas fragariae (ex Marin et al. 2024) TaxID=3080056 RepID=UPI003F78D6E3
MAAVIDGMGFQVLGHLGPNVWNVEQLGDGGKFAPHNDIVGTEILVSASSSSWAVSVALAR